MNLDEFVHARTETMPVPNGGKKQMDETGKIMGQWMIVGIVLTVFIIVVFVVLSGSCDLDGVKKPNQVIANQCQCEGDKVDIDFSKNDENVDENLVCTVWVLMENLNMTRIWVDTRVKCRR